MAGLSFSGSPLDVEIGNVVATPDGGFLVIEADWVQSGDSGDYVFYRHRYDAFGEEVRRPTLLGEPDDTFRMSSPQALADGSLVFVATEIVPRPNGGALFTHRVVKQAADGSLVTLRTYRAEDPPGSDAFNPATRTPALTVAADGSLVVTRSAGTEQAEERVVDVLGADGSVRSLGEVVARAERALEFDVEQTIALADGRQLVTWNIFDLAPTSPQSPHPDREGVTYMGRFVGADGRAQGEAFVIRTDRFSEPVQSKSAYADVVALPDGGFAVTTRITDRWSWPVSDERFLALYDATGARTTADQRYGASHQIASDSVVASLGDGRLAAFWVVLAGDWNRPSQAFTVYGQMFSADGELTGAEFVVGRGRAAFAGLSEVTVLADGRLAVSWDESNRDGGEGEDHEVVQILDPRTEAIVFEGTAAIDRVIGTGRNDTLSGAGGHDTLDGAGGLDLLAGGAGNDTFVIDDPRDRVVEVEGGGIDGVRAGVGATLAANVENLILIGGRALSGTGNELGNLVLGNEAANALSGLDGDDILDGAGGHDTLDGGNGRDVLYGRLGNDTYVLRDRGDDAVERAGQGTDTLAVFFSAALSEPFENLTLMGSAGLNGTGDAGANVLTGNDGGNRLDGLGGNDTLDGGGGADLLRGGAGDDTYVLGDRDTVVEAVGGGRDTVRTAMTYRLGDGVEDLVLTGTTAIDGTGNAAANVLTGNAAANLLSGGLGADTLVGGAGDDVYVVDASDQVVEDRYVMVEGLLEGAGVDTVRSAASYSLTELHGVERLELVGRAVEGRGNAGDNEIVGNRLDNRLDGDGGHDTLIGGAGRDIFVFNHGLSRRNVVTIDDFGVSDDAMLLSSSVFERLGPPGSTVAAEAFVVGPRATERDDRLIYDAGTGELFFDGDGSGAGRAWRIGQLDAGLALTADDFHLL